MLADKAPSGEWEWHLHIVFANNVASC